METVLLELLYS